MRARLFFPLLLVSLLGARSLPAAPTAKPAVSAAVRVLSDNNLFLQEEAPLASGQTQRATPANVWDAAVDASVTLGLGWKFAPGRSLDLGYTPEFVRYLDHASENHTDHAVTAAGAIEAGPWSAEFKARYLEIIGSDEAPVYNALGGIPAVGGEPVRSRRAQAVSRASGKITRRFSHGWARQVFSFSDQEFHTRERLATGYCNYADRREVSTGLEVGRSLAGGLAAVAAVRTGVQRQANVLGVPLNFSNSFARYLAGVEGSPVKTLKLALLVGPDIRHYGASARAGFEREQRTAYGEASATWTPTKRDTLGLTGKRYLWVASGGRGIYADALVDLTWKRQLAEKWSASAGFNWHDYDTSHFNAWAPRHDRVYLATLGISRALPKKTRVDFELLHDRGLSLVANTPGRDYSRWVASVTVARTW